MEQESAVRGPTGLTKRRSTRPVRLNRGLYTVSKHWWIVLVVLAGLWVLLPWLAPLFMHWGWIGPAKAIYALYSFQCHQLPQRSFFLFGPQSMYSLDQIRAIWGETTDPLILRQFVGNAEMGYKVAWSDRMVSAYSIIPLAALLWWPFRRRLGPLPLWVFVLLALPMALDGGTHLVSDLSGLGQGFRYTNEWLAQLTGWRLPDTFYAGTTLGSFNSWMRLITGVLFGFGLMALSLPYLHAEFAAITRQIEAKFDQAGILL